MFQEMMVAGNGGGSNNVKSGNGFYDSNDNFQTETTSANQVMVIKTGLSSVKHFMLRATPKYSGYRTYVQVLDYNADTAPTKFGGACIYGGGAMGGCDFEIGVNSNGYNFRMMSISGGDITIWSPANTYYEACDNIVWFAE